MIKIWRDWVSIKALGSINEFKILEMRLKFKEIK